jgi:predicted DNA-binding ribbon-helix-helix protein
MSRPGSSVLKHTVVLGGHHTSVSLEYEFWKGLREIADRRGEPLSHLITRIDAEREFANLSSVLRLFVLAFYRDQYNSGKLVDLASQDARPVALG